MKAPVVAASIVMILVATGAAYYFLRPSSAPEPVTGKEMSCATLLPNSSGNGVRAADASDPHLKLIAKVGAGDGGDTYYSDDCFVYRPRGGTDAWVVEGADPNKFKILGLTGSIKPPDCDEVECLDEISVGKDDNHVFVGGEEFATADAASFTLLTTPSRNVSIYAKDKNHIYMIGGRQNIILDADPATFQVTDVFTAKDATHSWVNGMEQ